MRRSCILAEQACRSKNKWNRGHIVLVVEDILGKFNGEQSKLLMALTAF
ncbi:MAG: hypothetical protein ACLT3C_03695 [Peptococcus niger]